jgi:hypothetical protein
MSGRRSHPRFVVASPWDGAVRVLRDVVIDRTQPDEFLAVSHSPGVLGEEMSLDLIGAGATLALKVQVLDSRPVIIDGSVRHRIRLRVVDAALPAEVPPSAAAAGPEQAAEAV